MKYNLTSVFYQSSSRNTMWHTDNAPAAQATRKPDSFLGWKK